jgi:hypothetical protein
MYADEEETARHLISRGEGADRTDDRHWHNGGDIEIMMYALSPH